MTVLLLILDFCKHYWKIILACLALIVVIGIFHKYCQPKPPKINEKELQEAQQAIRSDNDKKLKEILTNIDVRQKGIDQSLSNAKLAEIKAIEESKKKYQNMNSEELRNEYKKLLEDSQ